MIKEKDKIDRFYSKLKQREYIKALEIGEKIKKEGKEGLDILLEMANVALNRAKNLELGEKYTRELTLLAKRESDYYYEGIGLCNIGTIHLKRGDNLRADAFFKKALNKAKAESDKIYTVKMLINYASALMDSGNAIDAKIQIYKILKLKDDIIYSDNLQLNYYRLYNTIGYVFTYCGDYEEAISYFLEGEKYCKNDIELILFYNNIAAAYQEFEKHEEAKKYLDKGYELAKNIERKLYLSLIYENYAVYYKDIGQIDTARKYLQSSIEITGATPSRLIHLAEIEEASGNIEKAASSYYRAIETGERLGLKIDLFEAYLGVCNICLHVGDIALALNYFKKAEKINNSIKMPPFKKKINEIQNNIYKHQAENRQNTNKNIAVIELAYYQLLLDLLHNLNNHNEINKMLNYIVEQLTDIFEAKKVYVGVWDEKNKNNIYVKVHSLEIKNDKLPKDKYYNDIILNTLKIEGIIYPSETERDKIICVPVIRRGRTIGVILVELFTGSLTDNRIRFLKGIADNIALAVENAILFTQTKRGLKQIKLLNKQLELNLSTERDKHEKIKKELENSKKALEKRYKLDTKDIVIGQNKKILDILNYIEKIVDLNAPVLIEGETGTGKEVIANMIHYNSKRKGKSFVSLNCSTLPMTLVESELFGYVKGAFTGAHKNKKGLFLEADGGTLFLDEIGTMPANIQQKILRVIQEGVLRPVGGTKDIKVNVRLICASNLSLKELVNKKIFREDLFYRINVFKIELPPLRHRKQDLPEFFKYFSQKIASEFNIPEKRITSNAFKCIVEYNWPGNIREFENFIRRLYILQEQNITISNINLKIGEMYEIEHENISKIKLKNAVKKYKYKLILNAIRDCNGNKCKAAKSLGISRQHLYKILEEVN